MWSIFSPSKRFNGGVKISNLHSQALWRKRIRQKFQNTRHRKEKSLDLVKENKMKYGTKASDETEPSVSSVSKEMLGIKHYLPEKPASEDDDSQKHHVQWLKDSTSSRKESDNEKVNRLMNLTLHKRREMLVIGAARPAEVLKEYPWLQAGPGQVLKEMSRISEIDVEAAMLSSSRDMEQLY